MNSGEYERICRMVCNILIVATLIVVKYLVTCSIVSKVNHMILSILGSDVLVLYVVYMATGEVVYGSDGNNPRYTNGDGRCRMHTLKM